MTRRVNIRTILADPVLRRRLLAHTLQATQAREGRDISIERAYEVVDRIAKEGRPRAARKGVN